MGDKILVCVLIVIGSGIIAYASIGRIFGFHRPIKYLFGGQVGFTGELSGGVFLLCGGMAVLYSSVWIIPAIAAFAVGFISQEYTRRQYIAKKKKLRQENEAGPDPKSQSNNSSSN